MIFFLLTASFLWWATLVNFVFQDYRLLLRTTRVATTIYLVAFGLLVAEVLREGLFVVGLQELQGKIRFLWMCWFLLVVAGTIYWQYLIPAAIIAIWVFTIPDIRTLLNYGLVRLGWLEITYNPIWFAVSRPLWPIRLLEILHGPEFLVKIRSSEIGKFMVDTTTWLEGISERLPWIGSVSRKIRELERY
ncbi:hypothetical protein F4776DRAFT_554258 [Hypoxylon sp. NC0597]|nr:hypothetical protein F4776DRAFT_554258 [Hypoxylon sp. NC0597]